MILGIPTSAYTFIHVLLSLIGIGSGFVVLYGFISGKLLHGWTGLFLVTTVATSVTGYGHPAHNVTPGHIIGAISLVVLAIAILALYGFHLAGAWRTMYVVSASLALYFNFFVLVVQSFEKVPALKELAPTHSEPPFAITQLSVLAAFIVLTVTAVKRFQVEPAHAV
jgi:hypothetical protein